MAALHPATTLLTFPHMYAKASPFHARRWNLSLILPLHAGLANGTSAGTTLRQHRLQRLIHLFRNRTTTRCTILGICFPPWWQRMSFRFTAGKRERVVACWLVV